MDGVKRLHVLYHVICFCMGLSVVRSPGKDAPGPTVMDAVTRLELGCPCLVKRVQLGFWTSSSDSPPPPHGTLLPVQVRSSPLIFK